jgi:flavorubredoxin/flavin reductase (DIM6/NTAB) family NADH-FMN oxidoreductase RutF
MPDTLSQSTIATQKPRDVQVLPVAANTMVLRSRSWSRLRFEIEYALERGTTANSYLITSDRAALIDPPGESFTQSFLDALSLRFNIAELDYIVLGHVNPNRAATLKVLLERAPKATIVCSNPAAVALRDLFSDNVPPLHIIKGTGDERLDLGQGHKLQFLPLTTPRYPDGLCTYDPQTQIAYTDKFFGAHICGDQIFDEGWTVFLEDRRYYFDCLMAPYARQVAIALDKVDSLNPLALVAPGHGPLVRYGLTELLHAYRQWGKEQRTKDITVALLFASAYGNTATIGQAIARGITKSGVAVESINCESADTDEVKRILEQCDGFIFGSPTLGGHLPTQVQTALGIALSTVPKDKLTGVFGSFGWSGEAIDLLDGKLRDAGYSFGFEPIRVKFKPTDVILKTCEEAGTDFAQSLKKAKKRRSPKQSALKSSSTVTPTEQAMGRMVGSLCIVTTRQGDLSSAMLASWVSQATFSPPGLTVSVAKDRAIESLLYPDKPFVLNILAEDNYLGLMKHFLKPFSPGEDRFQGVNTDEAESGCPILSDALAYLDCRVKSRMECGDHWVIYATIGAGEVFKPDVKTAVHHRKSGDHY